MAPLSILVVDDELEICDLLVDALVRNGFNAHSVNSGKEAKELIASVQFDIVLSDINMPRMSGVELLAYIQQEAPKVSVILMTGALSESEASAAEKGACGLIKKPFDEISLLEQINAVMNGVTEEAA